MRNIRDKKAQTALELAVFGSILIFILGTIISSSVNRSNQQHAILKAARMALAMSHQTTISNTVAGRNMATVMIIEDRLTAASAKYGAIDRAPFMTQGSGMHSTNLFMPVNFRDLEDLPVFDMFINGKHFVFTTAGFKSVVLAVACTIGDPGCDGGFQPGEYETLCPGNWEPECLVSQDVTLTMLPCAGVSPCPPPSPPAAAGSCPNGCDPTVLDMYEFSVSSAEVNVGCAKLYTVVDNHPSIDAWCDDASGTTMCPPDCSVTQGAGCNMPVDQRFDLDRGLAGFPPATDPTDYEDFSWQWFMVMGVNEKWLNSRRARMMAGNQMSGFPTAEFMSSEPVLNMAEGIVLPGGGSKIKNATLDVDCDLKLETIMPNVEDVDPKPNASRNGIITRIGVQDPNEGDLDFTYNSSDELLGIEQFGFTRDVRLFTFIRDDTDLLRGDTGTYFEIDEGKLFGNNRQFIRTTSKKDQVDLIERVWQLSNNTGRYCGADGYAATDPTIWGNNNNFTDASNVLHTDITAGESIRNYVNPVEVCATDSDGCYTTANVNRTCMATFTDEDTGMERHLIFVRSRIQDLHGRKWVTEMGTDPYIDFTGYTAP